MLKTDRRQEEEESIMKITFTSAFLHQGKGSNRGCKCVLQSEPKQSLWADTWIGCSWKMNLLSTQHAPRNRLWNTSFADFFPPSLKRQSRFKRRGLVNKILKYWNETGRSWAELFNFWSTRHKFIHHDNLFLFLLQREGFQIVPSCSWSCSFTTMRLMVNLC